MKTYTVTANVSVYVEIKIKAESAAKARELFGKHIMMTSGLADVPDESFAVEEDSIMDMDNVKVIISGT